MSTPTKKRTPKKLSESDKANLIRDHTEGNYSQTGLSEKYGCSKSSVQRIIKSAETSDQQHQVLFCMYF